MSQERAKLFKSLSLPQLTAFAAFQQDSANELQRKARTAQKDADAARKEVKRRQRQ